MVDERRNGTSVGNGHPARKPLRRPPLPGLRFQSKETEQYHICLSAPGIARMDERRFAASILDAILGGSASSRLFQEIREKRGMAYSVYSYSSQYEDAGQIALRARARSTRQCLEIAVSSSPTWCGNVERGATPRRTSGRLSWTRVDFEPHDPARPATVTDPAARARRSSRIEAVSTGKRRFAAELLAPGRLSAAGIVDETASAKRSRESIRAFGADGG
jgi:hypothetical protein